MQDINFLSPKTLTELTGILAEPGRKILAGGTDLIPKMRRSHIAASTLVDISQLEELRYIREQDDRIHIGALTTHQEMADSALLQEVNPALVTAALTVGCQQTRNRGTIGGNIANASPAADTIPALLVFDADVHLLSKAEERILALEEFLVGPGSTKILEGEVIQGVSFERCYGAWGVSFLKLGKRNGMAISVVSAAAGVILDPDGKITRARLCLGSAAPKVTRSLTAENILIGQRATLETLARAAVSCLDDISPMSDVRSTAAYRRHSAVVMARRVLEQAVNQASRRQI